MPEQELDPGTKRGNTILRETIKAKLVQAQTSTGEVIHGSMEALKPVYLTETEINQLLWRLAERSKLED